MVRERFCWPNRKVAIPVMCCEEVQHGLKGTYSPVFLGRHTHMCVSQAYHAHAFRFFCWPEWPENRDGTHQLLGQREPEVSVWHGAEKETAGGGGGDSKNQHKSQKKPGSQMVMVETSIHSEFPAPVPCLSPLDYFLVQRLPHFKASFLPTPVISACSGAYISAEKPRKS